MAALCVLTMTLAGCKTAPSEIHVSALGSDETGNGSAASPYATISRGLADVQPGSTLYVHAGVYAPFEVRAEASGKPDAPVVIRAAENETPVIDGKQGTGVGILMNNVSNITLSGFTVEGGKYGVYYSSTADQGDAALENITIQGCTVRGIRGYHGICVYACNDRAPVKNLVVEDCRVYDCECYSSESTVFNGNIDGFIIRNNIIHDNNNIGIDMIGFEGNAMHADAYDGNPYDMDYVRNGICCGNVVYNISAYGNPAYRSGGAYDLCADGIYVDGGQNIEIYENFIFNCDIGVEVATEHSPDDNALFSVSGVEVHDNVIASCAGWCGLAFGGYDADLGFTKDCSFHHNTFVDNAVQIGVQRSTGNRIYRNLFVGGETGVDYNTDCREADLINAFFENLWCAQDELLYTGSYDAARLFDMKAQQFAADRALVLDGLASAAQGFGSSFVPSETQAALYFAQLAEDG